MPSRNPFSAVATKVYPFLPHAKVDAMAQRYAHSGYEITHYKLICTQSLISFILCLISFASCWHALSFVGIAQVFVLLLPYVGQIAHPKVHFGYLFIAIIMVFVNLCGELANLARHHHCWTMALFVELPLILVMLWCMRTLCKLDPAIGKRFAGLCRRSAEPSIVSHPTTAVVAAPQPTMAYNAA